MQTCAGGRGSVGGAEFPPSSALLGGICLYRSCRPSRNTYRVRARLPDGTRRMIQTGFATHEQAQRFADAATVEMRDFSPVQGNNPTLVDYGRTWLRRRELEGHRNSVADRCRFERHIATAPFAKYPMVSLDSVLRLAKKTTRFSRARSTPKKRYPFFGLASKRKGARWSAPSNLGVAK